MNSQSAQYIAYRENSNIDNDNYIFFYMIYLAKFSNIESKRQVGM